MKKKTLIGTTLALLAAVMLVSAVPGMAWRGGPDDCPGPYGDRYENRRGYADSRLSEEQVAKLDASRKAFFDETKGLRTDIYEKRLDLRKELIQESPDLTRAKGIQRDISKLEAKLEEKRLEHRMKMRAELGDDFDYGYGRGEKRGRGGYGRGGCRW